MNVMKTTIHAKIKKHAIAAIKNAHGSMFLVGDPKQSIYRWRGANPEIFSSLKKTSPFHLKPEVVSKKINFRPIRISN